MLHVFLAAETSKVPFYIAGLLLALWAVVLSAFGLSRPNFPSNVAGQRGVIAITVLLMAFAVGAAIGTG